MCLCLTIFSTSGIISYLTQPQVQGTPIQALFSASLKGCLSRILTHEVLPNHPSHCSEFLSMRFPRCQHRLLCPMAFLLWLLLLLPLSRRLLWAGACLKDRFLFITSQQQPGRLAAKLDGGRSPASPKVRGQCRWGISQGQGGCHSWLGQPKNSSLRPE